MVNLCDTLTGLRDAQITDKPLFLGMSVKISPEKISIYISRQKKEVHPHQYEW